MKDGKVQINIKSEERGTKLASYINRNIGL